MLATFSQACSQDTPQNFAVWPGFEFLLPFREGGRWGLFAEGYMKLVDFVKNPQALFWRFGGTYYLKNGNHINGGLAWQYNYPYDEASLPYEWPDWRIWQQYMIRRSARKNKNQFWVHRFRLEER